MRRLVLLPLAAALIALAAPTVAAPCKDAKGKFVKCPDKKPVRCKGPNGKFAKCGSPGAKPA